MGTLRAPHFDGTNYPYWEVRMASRLEAVGLDVWRVTNQGMNPIKRPDNPIVGYKKEMHSNSIARDILLSSLSIGVFNRVSSLTGAHDIWLTLMSLHDGTRDVKEQKVCLVKNAFDTLKMLPHELANDMYSHLNIIVNEYNSIGDTKLTDANVTRKIIQVLPTNKYEVIITYLLINEESSKMTPTKIIGKITSYEMFNNLG